MKRFILALIFVSSIGSAYDSRYLATCTSPTESLDWDLEWEKADVESVLLIGTKDSHDGAILFHRFQYKVLPSLGDGIVFVPGLDPQKGVAIFQKNTNSRLLIEELLKREGMKLDSSYTCRNW